MKEISAQEFARLAFEKKVPTLYDLAAGMCTGFFGDADSVSDGTFLYVTDDGFYIRAAEDLQWKHDGMLVRLVEKPGQMFLNFAYVIENLEQMA